MHSVSLLESEDWSDFFFFLNKFSARCQVVKCHVWVCVGACLQCSGSLQFCFNHSLPVQDLKLAVRDWYPLRALNHVHNATCIFSLLNSHEYFGDFKNPLRTFHSPSIFSQDLALTTDTVTENEGPACLPLRDQ